MRNRQFVGASISLLLFGVGMMGTLFMTVLLFVNLWDYTELEAALAITPVAVMAMLVAPMVGRLANRVQPRVFGIPALLVTALGAVRCSQGCPPSPTSSARAWRLALLGRGRRRDVPGRDDRLDGLDPGPGAGARLRDREHGRQVGFAIGMALFVAVFTGALDNGVEAARARRCATPTALRSERARS